MGNWRGGPWAGGMRAQLEALLPSIHTSANKGRQYLAANGAGTGVTVLAGTSLRVGSRYATVDVDVEVTTLDAGVLTLGTDYYVYAVYEVAGIGFVLSANATVPAGYTVDTSRKIGGFHYGRVRTTAQAYDRTAALAVQVVPNSVWDLFHRPRSAPEGMAQITDSLWMDIYLSSEDGTAWPDSVPLSRYNATPLSGTEGYSYYDMARLATNAGKRRPTYDEWLQAAWGVPEGATSAGARIATGGVGFALPGGNPSSSEYYWVSCLNVDQTSGNLWQALAEYWDLFDGVPSTGTDGTFGWTGVDAGKGGNAQGSVYNQSFKQLIAGGYWVNGTNAGARCADLRSPPWVVYGSVGLRCVSDSL